MTDFARGELVMVSLDPVKGHEQGKRRPCVVLSSTLYNGRSSCLVVAPVTSKVKGYPFEVSIEAGSVRGAVLVDQLRTLDTKARGLVSIGVSVSFSELHLIQAKLDALLFR